MTRAMLIKLAQKTADPEIENLVIKMFPKEDRVICSNIGCCPGAESYGAHLAQGYGCLPTLFDTVQMRVKHGKTWACHNDYSKPCLGALKELRRRGLNAKPTKDLLTLDDYWEDFI